MTSTFPSHWAFRIHIIHLDIHLNSPGSIQLLTCNFEPQLINLPSLVPMPHNQCQTTHLLAISQLLYTNLPFLKQKMACIANMARIQHRQLNYQPHTCHNCDMLIMKFDLWWPELSEVPQNPASIPSATSLAREWLAEALFSQSILTLSGWWARR